MIQFSCCLMQHLVVNVKCGLIGNYIKWNYKLNCVLFGGQPNWWDNVLWIDKKPKTSKQ